MPKTSKKKAPSRTARTRAKSSKSKPAERFVNDLLVRGEAAKPNKEGKLPLQATHVITEEKDGTVKVRRVRFKLY